MAIIEELFGVHWYNSPTTNEREIELPMAKHYLSKHHKNFKSVIELGAVTCYYYAIHHNIIDLMDKHPLVTFRMNAHDFDFTNLNVLSISTIEHIEEGYKVIDRIFKTAKSWFITIPIGFNPELDEWLQENTPPGNMFFLLKTGEGWIPLVENCWGYPAKRETAPAKSLCVMSNEFGIDDFYPDYMVYANG